MILALDPSRVLGWCRGEPGGAFAFGHVELARRGAAPGAIGFALKEFLNETIMAIDPDLIVYERPFLPTLFINGHMSFVLQGLGFLIDTIATEYGIEPASVMAGEATRALTVRGNKYPGDNYTARR